MSTNNPITFNEFFSSDLMPGLLELKKVIGEVSQTVVQFQGSIGKALDRGRKSISENEASLKELAESTRRLNVLEKNAAEVLIEVNKEVDKRIKKTNQEREAVSNLNNAFDASAASLNHLMIRQKALEAEYRKLNPAMGNNKEKMTAIAQELAVVSKFANHLNNTLKQQKRTIDVAENSYDALDKRLKSLRSDLKSLPNAFDSNTGAINRTNKKAVELQREIDHLANKLQKMDKQMGVHNRNVGNYGSAFAGLLKSMTGVGLATLGIGTLSDFFSKIYDTANKLEQTNQALKFTSGSTQNFVKNQQYLKDTTQQLDLEYISTSKAFKLWTGAAKESGMATDEQRKIFGNVAKAASTMKLSAEDTEGVFLALSQMMSKGKVQAEELRGQLGERLPGAFNIAARAMGVTEQELNNMLQKREVIAKDFLPRFSNELEKTFGGTNQGEVKGMQAEVNRLKNNFTEFVQGLSDNGLNSFIADLIAGLGSVVGLFAEWVKVPLEDKLKREQTELNALVSSIISTNTHQEIRNSLIKDLQEKYPDFLGKLDAETIGNDQLLRKLKEVNSEYKMRFNLIANEKKITKIQEQQNIISDDRNKEIQTAQLAFQKVLKMTPLQSSRIEFGSNQYYDKLREAYKKINESEFVYRQKFSPSKSKELGIGKDEVNDLEEIFIKSGLENLINKSQDRTKNYEKLQGQINDLQSANSTIDQEIKNEKIANLKKRIEEVKQEIKLSDENQKLLKIKGDYTQKEKAELARLTAELNQFISPKAESDTTNPTPPKSSIKSPKKSAETLAKEIQEKSLKALDGAKEVEIAQLDILYTKKEILEVEYQERKANIEIKFLRDKAKLYENSDKQLHQSLTLQADKAEIEKNNKLAEIREKGLQNTHQIALSQLEVQRANLLISEEDYEKKKTELAIQELKRKLALEVDLVKKSEIEKQIALAVIQQKAEGKKAKDKTYQSQKSAIEAQNKSERKLDKALVDNGKITEAEATQKEIDRLYKLVYLAGVNGNKDDLENITAQIEAAQERKLTALKEVNKKIITEIRSFTDEINSLISTRLGNGFGRIFQTLSDQMFEFAENGKIAFKDAADKISFFANIAQGALSVLSEYSANYSQERIQMLESEKQRSIELAGDDADAKQRIEEEYNRRIRHEKNQQAKKDRQLALFQIAINTAAAVASVLSTGGGTRYADLGITAGVLTAMVIGMGAAQAALVASQPLPEFWKGTNHAPEGLAHLAERGPELVQSPSGRATLVTKPSIGYLEQGSKVFTAAQTKHIYEQMQFQNYVDLNPSLAKMISSGANAEKISHMKQALQAIKIDEEAIGAAVGKYLNNLPLTNWTVDENGFSRKIRKGNTTVEKLNKRFSLD